MNDLFYSFTFCFIRAAEHYLKLGTPRDRAWYFNTLQSLATEENQ